MSSANTTPTPRRSPKWNLDELQTDGLLNAAADICWAADKLGIDPTRLAAHVLGRLLARNGLEHQRVAKELRPFGFDLVRTQHGNQ